MGGRLALLAPFRIPCVSCECARYRSIIQVACCCGIVAAMILISAYPQITLEEDPQLEELPRVDCRKGTESRTCGH